MAESLGSSEIDRLRLRGIEMIAVSGWGIVVLMFALGMWLGSDRAWITLALGALANLAPTIIAYQRRFDANARMTIGSLAAVHPALAVYALTGHAWQMDAHMYFFVALSMLTVLYDWRPIAIAAGLIAVHHVVLEVVAPEWVFMGEGNFGRVLFHAAAVILELAVLSYVTVRLSQLVSAQDEARAASERFASDADARRDDAEAAMAAMRAAEAREATERTRRETIERDSTAARRQEMLVLATGFQESVADAMRAVTHSAADLDQSARALNDLAHRASDELEETAKVADQASTSAEHLAIGVEGLAASIMAIAASVDQQAQLSGTARNVSNSGESAVQALANQASSITDFAQSIHEIAARTNLLALNATIEAARAGDVGRGFAVVAHEVKQLAGQASGATEEIRSLAGTVHGGAAVAHSALAEIAATVAEVAAAAQAIRTEVDTQREATRTIEETARDTATGANQMAERISAVAGVAADTEELSDRVSNAATTLSRTARALQDATERFVAQLKAA